MALSIVVERKKKSWNFKVNPKEPDSFSNNINNNMIDTLRIFDDKAELFSCPVQSVANYCWGEMKNSMVKPSGDTIKEGYFKVGLLDKAFSIINDGEKAEVYYTGAKSLLFIKTSIGIAGILPFNPMINVEEKKTVIEAA